jgi:hypothetical protein
MKPFKENVTPDKAATNNSFESSDIYLSSFLMARGVPLKGTKRDKARTFFMFPDSEELQALIHEYYADGAVRALTFKSYLRELKILVHGGFKGR